MERDGSWNPLRSELREASDHVLLLTLNSPGLGKKCGTKHWLIFPESERHESLSQIYDNPQQKQLISVYGWISKAYMVEIKRTKAAAERGMPWVLV